MNWLTEIRDFLAGSKTYIIAITAIVAAVVAFYNGAIDVQTMIEAIFVALGVTTVAARVTRLTKKG